ncbi:MAG: tetratricopeptide repeat protein, partial [Kiritimatiellae bacterium]|nr:tetratricopeptide repeat protein [Kiritimatiellia bacterium]
MNLKNNPELIPLIEWWEKDGRQTVIWLVVAAVAVGGWYGWKHHRAAVRNAASDSLVNTYTTAEVEEAVSKFSGSAIAGSLKIRLAKHYFDDGRFKEALDQYEALIGKAPEGFSDIPVVGKAQCLEALGRFDEAVKAFDEFTEASPKHYLTLTTQLGAARCCAQLGDKKKALARIETLKTVYKDDDIAKARVEATETLIKRYEKPAAKPAAPAAKPAAPAAPAAKPA